MQTISLWQLLLYTYPMHYLGAEETDLAEEEWAEQGGMCEAAALDRVDLVED